MKNLFLGLVALVVGLAFAGSADAGYYKYPYHHQHCYPHYYPQYYPVVKVVKVVKVVPVQPVVEVVVVKKPVVQVVKTVETVETTVIKKGGIAGPAGPGIAGPGIAGPGKIGPAGPVGKAGGPAGGLKIEPNPDKPGVVQPPMPPPPQID